MRWGIFGAFKLRLRLWLRQLHPPGFGARPKASTETHFRILSDARGYNRFNRGRTQGLQSYVAVVLT